MEPRSFLPVVVAVLPVLCLLLTSIYRIFLHPLAKYPGPTLAVITDWYNVYHAWKGDRHIDIHKLHERYGDVVRYAPARISINTPKALHEIYDTKSNVRKSRLYDVFGSFFGRASSGSIIDKTQHGARRRVVGQALTISAFKTMESILLEKVRGFCDDLADCKFQDGFQAEWSAGRNITDWLARLTVDIIGEMLFGRTWHAVNKRSFIGNIPEGTKGFLMAGHMPAILTFKLDSVFLRGVTRRARDFESVTRNQLRQRLALLRDKQNDLLEKLLAAQDAYTGNSMSEAELHAEVMTFMYRIRHHGYYRNRHLILPPPQPTHTKPTPQRDRQYLCQPETIKLGPRLNSCIYLSACLDETLRLNPPVGGVLPREVLKGGMTIDGNFFSEGTDVGTSLYALQRQEKYFRNALVCEPQRWIDKAGSNNAAFAPFSLGARACPAKAMAYAEMMVMLARIVFSLEMRLLDETGGSGGERRSVQFQTKDFFVSTHDGPVVQFRKRKLAR